MVAWGFDCTASVLSHEGYLVLMGLHSPARTAPWERVGKALLCQAYGLGCNATPEHPWTTNSTVQIFSLSSP